jgi:hypothetical protein
MSKSEQDELVDAALTNAMQGDAILFVGAGASFYAKNSLNKHIPNGSELNKLMIDELKISGNYALDKVATHFIKKRGSATLLDLLQKNLKPTSVEDSYANFLRLPWKRIYTTNYDTVIEKSREGISGGVATTSISNSPKDVPTGCIVHINGALSEIAAHNVGVDLKLTDYSYATSSFESS